MANEVVGQALRSVFESRQAYCKFLSANDSGETSGHQCGILVSKAARPILFDHPVEEESILRRTVEIQWQNDVRTQSSLIYYRSKNELRITRFGRGFPFLIPEQTGALFVLTRQDEDQYSAFFLETDDDIEQFLGAVGLSTAETNRLIDPNTVLPEVRERRAIQDYAQSLNGEFPSSEIVSAQAREIQNRIHDHLEYIQIRPDKKLIDWTKTEYALFRAIEQTHYDNALSNGFTSVEAFVSLANEVLNRRKSRAGKSLEHHLAALFDGNHLRYTAQAKTEGNKRPDFLFPSIAAYQDHSFPTDKLFTLAAKTTCKDRWRQVLNETNRLRGRPLYLCTLQQGISVAQLDEMKAENVTLVVPEPYFSAYPASKRSELWTLRKFIDFAKETAQ